MLRNIHLYGEMAERFGAKFRLDVASLAESARALGSQLKGFRQYLVQHDYKIVCGDSLDRGMQLGEDQIDFQLPAGDIHILPVLQAAKSSGIGKIVTGVLIAAVAWWAAPAAAGLSGTLFGGLTYGNVVMMGLGLAVTGLSQALTKKDKPQPQTADNSFMLSGAINVTQQGGPVWVAYGRVIIGSVVISAGVTTDDIPISYVPPLGP